MIFDFKQFKKHKFKDAYRNMFYSFRARIWSKRYKVTSKSVTAPIGYKTIFEDNFNRPLNTDIWRYGQPWGDFHPDNLIQWYDSDGTLSYSSNEGLVLELRNLPKTYIKSQLPEWRQTEQLPDAFTIPIGVGMVSTKQSWQYGWFEAWIKLPKGKPYWPSFWLSGVNTWPPEIDIFEAYSHKGDKYNEKNLFGTMIPNQKIQTNIHYGNLNEGSNEMYGAWDIPVADCTERFVQYACLWEYDKIEIYYDGVKVFRCTDPEILKWFNAKDAQQYIIINHGYHQYVTGIPNDSTMLIKNVKVMQKSI